MLNAKRLVPTYAHTPGVTSLSYSPDGKYLLTAGSNQLIRKFTVGQEIEPLTIEQHDGEIYGLNSCSKYFASCSDDGTAALFNFSTNEFVGLLTRSPLPLRAIDFSPQGDWVAISGDKPDIVIVNTEEFAASMDQNNSVSGEDNDEASVTSTASATKQFRLPQHPRGVKHINFHPSGLLVSTSCLDGVLRFFSLSSQTPTLEKDMLDIVPKVDIDDDATMKVAWHPDGSCFAVATRTRQIAIYSRDNYEQIGTFSTLETSTPYKTYGGHNGMLTDLEWSPNGAYLASTSSDGSMLIWDAKSLKSINKFEQDELIQLKWNPAKNQISMTTSKGQLFTVDDPVPEQFTDITQPMGSKVYRLELGAKKPTSKPISNPLMTTEAPIARTKLIDPKPRSYNKDPELGQVDDLRFSDDNDEEDEPMENFAGLDDFVVDDDGAGYVPTRQDLDKPGRKRGASYDDDEDGFGNDYHPNGKRSAINPTRRAVEIIQDPFQPGSTPWQDKNRCMTMSSLGYVRSTITEREDAVQSITVHFFDRSVHREYHFTDNESLDMASMSLAGCLFARSGLKRHNTNEGGPNDRDSDLPAAIFFRFHDNHMEDWEITLDDPKDSIRAITASENLCVVCTTKGYVITYTIYGIPVEIYREAGDAIVTCASWKDYYLTIRQCGATNRLNYSIEQSPSLDNSNNRSSTSVFLQKNQSLGFNQNQKLLSAFFSHNGDPCIVGTDGILSVLLHWRHPTQARWVPLLDLDQLALSKSTSSSEGEKTLGYWPLGLVDDKFQCIILKGLAFRNGYPTLPLPPHSELDIHVPFESREFEQKALESRIIYNLRHDEYKSADRDSDSTVNSAELSAKLLEMDKFFLRLLSDCCKESKPTKAYSVAKLINKDNALAAATKIALRFQLDDLAEKINSIRERRILGSNDDDDE